MQKVVLNSPNRLLKGVIVSQRTDGYFSAKKMFELANMVRTSKRASLLRMDDYLQTQAGKDFVAEFTKEMGFKPYISTRGRNGETWLHPYLFIDIALWVSPKLKINVYAWIYDNLIKNRISSCDSYKIMCGALYQYAGRKDKFQQNIKKLANKIKELIGVEDWNRATQIQLERRDELQKLIADLTNTLKNSNEGLNLALKVYKNKYVEVEL